MSRPGVDRGQAAVAAPVAADLAAFADANVRRGPQCFGCRLPEDLRGELRTARRSDPTRYTFPILAGYAKSKGHPISHTCLRDHFRKGHEGEAA